MPSGTAGTDDPQREQKGRQPFGDDS